MKIQLNKVFPLNSTVEAAWMQLQNIEQVAACMPGAEIVEKTHETQYKGKASVKLGPVQMAFHGDIKVADINASKRQIHLIAGGKDSKGTSNASMDLLAFIRAGEATTSELVGEASVTVNGKLANFGGRMMTQVADQILCQFVDNFSAGLSSKTNASDVVAEPEKAHNNALNGCKTAWRVIVGFFKSFFARSA